MATTPTPVAASPTEPSPITPTSNSPRPTPVQEIIPISFNSWQPQPTLLSLGPIDPITIRCLDVTATDESYFLDLMDAYELRLAPGRNQSLASIEFSGIYHLNTMQDPLLSRFKARFNDQETVPTLNPYSSNCAHFTFSVQVGTDTPEGSSGGFLTFPDSNLIAFPHILITSAKATLLPQASPETTPAPTFGGGLDSTVDSSIGQSTNETALPASGNVPVSASSSSSSPKASVIAPAIVVPVVFVLAALAAFFLWRRHRRARLAPSAAFRADNADAVEAMQRQGGTVGLGGTGTSQVPPAGVSLPAQSSSYFPLDEKRPLGP